MLNPPSVEGLTRSLYVLIDSEIPRSMLWSTMCGVSQSLTNAWIGGCPFKFTATFTTRPPCSMQYGGVSDQPPARSSLAGERPQTIWSSRMLRAGRTGRKVISSIIIRRSLAKALSREASDPVFNMDRNMASCTPAKEGSVASEIGAGGVMPRFPTSSAVASRSSCRQLASHRSEGMSSMLRRM